MENSFEARRQIQIKQLADRKNENWIKTTALNCAVEFVTGLTRKEREAFLQETSVIATAKMFEKYLRGEQ